MSVPCGGDALDGVVRTGERRDVRLLVLDGGLADSAFVLDGVALCPRRVDDKVHLLVQDDIENVRAAFGYLVHHFALHAGLLVELGGAFGSVNLEAELLEFLANFNRLFRQVNLVGKADKHGTFVREEGTCGFLALVVSEGVVVGEAEHFDYDDRSAYSLTLASDDSLRRVAYGSQECCKPWRPEAPCGKILLWAFPHIHVRSGYILWVARFTPFPPNLIKRSLAPKNIGQGQPASLRPKGSLSLTRMLLASKLSCYSFKNIHRENGRTSKSVHFASTCFTSSYIYFFDLIIYPHEVGPGSWRYYTVICILHTTFL